MAAQYQGALGTDRRRHASDLRVLVVDDDKDTVDTLAAILESKGHVVQRAYHGDDVLLMVPAFRPDVILLDISVPGISGYAIAQAVRYSFTDIRRPLLIGISGVWNNQADRLVARQVGFDHYLVKPCDPEELLKLLSFHAGSP